MDLRINVCAKIMEIEYELIDNGVLLTDTECGLRIAVLNDDEGRGTTNQKVKALLGDWLHGEIENVIERTMAEKFKITIHIKPINK